MLLVNYVDNKIVFYAPSLIFQLNSILSTVTPNPNSTFVYILGCELLHARLNKL